MIRGIGVVVFLGMLALSSCTKKEASEASKSNNEASAAVQTAGGPHAFIHLISPFK
jgi:hypothetical protein